MTFTRPGKGHAKGRKRTAGPEAKCWNSGIRPAELKRPEPVVNAGRRDLGKAGDVVQPVMPKPQNQGELRESCLPVCLGKPGEEAPVNAGRK
jgi:hypothetical protein